MEQREGRPVPHEPGPGQESVWYYPRPAMMEATNERLRVEFDGVVIADTIRGYRVLETSHPPSHYLPAADCDETRFVPGTGRSFCEWKGQARYWSVRVDDTVVENGAWSYPVPSPSFARLGDHRAFYPHLFDCFVGDESVRAQAGGFYGGWITSKVVGPFKGEPGTGGW